MTDAQYNGDWITARRKINEGTDWRGTANVTIDGAAKEIGFRLLSESEFLELKRVIPLSELQEYEEDEQTEAEQRLQELQAKDDLDADEERELESLQEQVAAMQDSIEDALGSEAYDKIMWAGRKAIMPTDDDIQDFYNCSPQVQCEIAGVQSVKQLPQHMSDDDVEDILKNDMIDVISQQPYPIKFNIGMQAFMESVKVLGNGLIREETD